MYWVFSIVLMLIEPKSLSFQQQVATKIIKIDNTTNSKFMFKVKITNTQMFNIYPGKGYVPPGQHVNITVTIKKADKDISAKLLVQYAEMPDDKEYMEWSQIAKLSIRDELIPITRGRSKSREEARDGYKKTESPEYEPEMYASNKSSSQSIRQKQPSTEAVSPAPEVTSTVYHTIRQTQRNTSTMYRIDTTLTNGYLLEQELRTEKQKNHELKKKLVEREMRLRQYQNAGQKEINKHTQQGEEGNVVTHLNLCLLILACLLFGFMIAKSTPSPSSL